MRLRVLALDYDGTLAVDGRIDPSVPPALAEARARGLAVVLVTGRRVADLRGVLGDLRLFDAVVAENGALSLFPDTGRSTRLAPACVCGFLDALHAAGVTDAVAGECLVEMDAGAAALALEVIRRMELPLALHFNRGRLMALPLAVSKGTGLERTLRAMRLSPHNAVGVGDAENDHELLAACEVGVAVAWGSPALCAVADEVIEGDGPAAVAEYVRQVARSPRIPLPDRPRRRLLLGRDDAGQPVSLAVRGRNVLVAGEPKSGKSWVAGLLAEQLVLQGYSVCVIDPEGDYAALERLPGVVLLGGDDPIPSLDEVARLLRHADTSLVLDLVRLPFAERKRFVVRVLALLAELRRRTGLPHRVVVDEAHYFLHDAELARRLDLDLGGYTLVTYRATGLHPDLLAATDCVVVTRESEPAEVELLHASFRGQGTVEDWQRTLGGLGIEEAALLPVTDEAAGRIRRLKLAPRLTRHVRHRHKYLDLGVDPAVAFRFVGDDGSQGPEVRSLAELVETLGGGRPPGLDGHLRRGDLSRWLEHVFGDRALSDRLREVEERYRLGGLPDPVGAVIHAVEERYGAAEPS